ncbi:MAG TPA: SpoIID/LytB domain-containing protein, partial [Candidatus Omnitrophica bacterium]|nr:SpoIID/LytB domain-containing protein [Candidatus Omnitrophota bacterium]
KLSVINYINIEDYIKGVLFHEVSHRWPIESLKAQAIATRTYALYHAQMNKDKDYDVSSDIYSQVYGGKNSERYRTNKAVRLTTGLVLFYEGKIFPTYFHATCAGKTEDANQLWDINLPCLKSVDCLFCVGSPHFKWEKNIIFSQILDKLNAAGYNLESLEDIQIIERNNSNRVKILLLKSNKEELSISGKHFRQIMDPKEIRSLNFSLEINEGSVDFFGFGWGHGVGMCQWGAYFMSKQGYKYQSILQFYYSGAEIGKIKN